MKSYPFDLVGTPAFFSASYRISDCPADTSRSFSPWTMSVGGSLARHFITSRTPLPSQKNTKFGSLTFGVGRGRSGLRRPGRISFRVIRAMAQGRCPEEVVEGRSGHGSSTGGRGERSPEPKPWLAGTGRGRRRARPEPRIPSCTKRNASVQAVNPAHNEWKRTLNSI